MLLHWLLKHLQQTEISVLTSSIKGNGFYGSKGIMKLIPHLYLQLSDRFVKSSGNLHLKENKIFKYSKSDHSFHAKYLYLRYSSFWTLFMGSSNFGFSFFFFASKSLVGYRSLNRDIENQVLIIGASSDLQSKFESVP
jgi:hypothetical protein